MFLRRNTSSQEVLIGPFISDTDFKTPQTGLTIAASDVRLFKSNAVVEVSKNSGGGTHISGGRYLLVFDLTDTSQAGNLEVNIHVSGALPVKTKFVVLPESEYDVQIGGAQADVNVTYFGGDPVAAADGSGYIRTRVEAVSDDAIGVLSAQAGFYDAIRSEIMNVNPDDNYGSTTWIKRILIGSTSQRAVAVTGSHHAAADIHELQPSVIDNTHFATGAINANALAADAASEIATAVAATQALSRLDSMIESDGAGQFRFDTIALSMAAGGGGGDASQATLLMVKAKTDLITSGQVQYTSPVSPIGNIATPIFSGDDYKSSIGNAFTWTINARTGYSVSTATCRFGGSSEDTGDSWNVSGTVSDLGGGQWRLSFDLPKAITSALSPGFYRWSVELVNPGGDEVTEVYNSNANRQVEVRAKQT